MKTKKALDEFSSWPKWKKEISIGAPPLCQTKDIVRTKSSTISRAELIMMIGGLRGELYVAINQASFFSKKEASLLLEKTSFDVDE